METELEDPAAYEDEDPFGETDGYDWAIEQLREIVNKLSEAENPTARMHNPTRSLRTFNLINQLVDLIPSEADSELKDDNESTPR